MMTKIMIVGFLAVINIFGFCCSGEVSRLDNLKTVDDYMNICMDGKNHKTAPGPEEGLTNSVRSKFIIRITSIKPA